MRIVEVSWYPWNHIMNDMLHQPFPIVHANIVRHSTTTQLDWSINSVETRFLCSEHMRKGMKEEVPFLGKTVFIQFPLN